MNTKNLNNYLKYLDERQDIPPYSFKVNPSGPKMTGGPKKTWFDELPLMTQFYLSALAGALIWTGLKGTYRVIRAMIDKTYKRCLAQSIRAAEKRRKPVYDACMYAAKLKGLQAGLKIVEKSGPKKCKEEKDKEACMKKLQSKISKIKEDIKKVRIKYNQAKKKADALKHKHKQPRNIWSDSGIAGVEIGKKKKG